MSERPCNLAAEVEEALRRGVWSDELEEHAAGCPDCSALVLVAEAMQRFAAEETGDASLPDPGLIWLRASRQARLAALDRATLPITIVRSLALACGAGLSIAGVVVSWPAISAWFGRMAAGLGHGGASAVDRPGAVLLVSAALLGLLALRDLLPQAIDE